MRSSKSLRFSGPLESATPALAVYEFGGAAGREEIFTTGAANNFGYIANYAMAFGTSTWTLYSNDNFTGTPICISGGGEMAERAVVFRSAIIGCHAQYGSGYVPVIGKEPEFHFD